MGVVFTISLSQKTFIYRPGLLPGSSEGRETSPWAVVAAAHEKSERLKSKWSHPSLSPAPRHCIVRPWAAPCLHLCVCKYNRIIYNHSCRLWGLSCPSPSTHPSVSCRHTRSRQTWYVCMHDLWPLPQWRWLLHSPNYKTVRVLCKNSTKAIIRKESSRPYCRTYSLIHSNHPSSNCLSQASVDKIATSVNRWQFVCDFYFYFISAQSCVTCRILIFHFSVAKYFLSRQLFLV